MIRDVLQQTWLDVGEKGTEAVAATAVVMRAGAAIREQPRVISFDRPFARALRARGRRRRRAIDGRGTPAAA